MPASCGRVLVEEVKEAARWTRHGGHNSGGQIQSLTSVRHGCVKWEVVAKLSSYEERACERACERAVGGSFHWGKVLALTWRLQNLVFILLILFSVDILV